MTDGLYSTVSLSMFVNIHKTAVFFEARSKSTANYTPLGTVSTKGSGSYNGKLKTYISVACNGTKLRLFLNFKGKPNRRIEQQPETLLTQKIYGSRQGKVLMDTRCMKVWIDKVWQPYICAYEQSALLFDDFSFHKSPGLLNALKDIGTSVWLMLGGYTCILQPCVRGIMRSSYLGIRRS